MAEDMADNRSFVGLLTSAECAFVSFIALLYVDWQVENSEGVAVDTGLVTPDSVDPAREHARDVLVGIFAIQAP
tara:strand:- start:542 stop:763 length:222 start_codon:yes stop_codon:yes gene_type:complete